MEGFVSRTGSSRGVSKQNGEIIAIPHPTMKKSYAGNESAGQVLANRCARAGLTRRVPSRVDDVA